MDADDSTGASTPDDQMNEIPEDHAAWRAAGQERFQAAYAEEDAVYESLIDEKSAE